MSSATRLSLASRLFSDSGQPSTARPLSNPAHGQNKIPKDYWSRPQHRDHGQSQGLLSKRSPPKVQKDKDYSARCPSKVQKDEHYFLVPEETVCARQHECVGLGLRFRNEGLSNALLAGTLKELADAAWISSHLVWDAKILTAAEQLTQLARYLSHLNGSPAHGLVM